MDAHTEQSDRASRGSFFAVAAWYSAVIPFASPVIWFVIAAAVGGRLGVACVSTLCILISSFAAGIVSAFGFSRHGRKGILWLAVIGITASIILGFVSYIYSGLSQNWHG
jgi:hypothetical protein